MAPLSGSYFTSPKAVCQIRGLLLVSFLTIFFVQFIHCFLQIIVISVISFRFSFCFVGCFVHEFLTFILDFSHRKLHFWAVPAARQAALNRWFCTAAFPSAAPPLPHRDLCEFPPKNAFRQNAEVQKLVEIKYTLATAVRPQYNQTKNRKEGFQVKIQIIQKQCGGTEFLAQPHRLHLGAQNAAGVDELLFQLPDAWAGCSLALYLRRSDGTLLAPVALDTQHRVTVDRRLTGSTGGQWMLAAMGENGYTAYTRPGSYDCYAILPIDDDAEELPPSLYEQFVARVLESSSSASTAAQRAAASAASTAANAAQAQTAAQRTSTDSANASQCAARAEAAAARAEELVPTDGQVVSVNGKSGIVKLTAQEVGALPCPAQPVSGQLLRVLSVDPNTGAVLTDTAAMPDLSPYLRSSTVPTASVPGAVRVDPACGINVRSDGTLTTAPADRSQLDNMDSTVLPLTPALLPYGVKKALTAAASAGEWTADDKAAALRTLGADLSSYYTKEDIDTLLSAPSSGAYPVGSIYQSTDPTSPAALFGGSWEEIASERVLMGASSTHAAGTTVRAGLPNITGSFVANVRNGRNAVSGAFTASDRTGATGADNSDAGIYTYSLDASRSNAIYGRSSTVQPAAYYVHIWHRVA